VESVCGRCYKIVNPDKLTHLGPIGDLRSLLSSLAASSSSSRVLGQ
jgi:hypothetical protein